MFPDPFHLPRVVAPVAALLALAACHAGTAPRPERTELVQGPGDSEPALDRRADGARIVGNAAPPPPHTDAEPITTVQVVRDGASIATEIDPSLDGAPVLHARFVADGVVTIGADHVLRWHARGRARELDRGAYGPISVAGSRIAYVRGAAPFLELARADVESGTTVGLTQGMAPTWSPALTPDGGAIVFVSGVQGTPRFYRIDGDGAPRALAPTQRTPGSPVAPRFDGELLVFDDAYGRAWVDLEQGQIVRTEEVAR